MFNHESFISIEKCLISTDLEIQNPCNKIDEENYTSEIILTNINKGRNVEKIDDFEEMFDFLLIKSIDLSFKMFRISKSILSMYLKVGRNLLYHGICGCIGFWPGKDAQIMDDHGWTCLCGGKYFEIFNNLLKSKLQNSSGFCQCFPKFTVRHLLPFNGIRIIK